MEDCEGVTDEVITQEFGEEICTLVDAVTKIGNIQFKDEKEYLASNHRKLFIAMAKDIRVILIKLADRLHNMRTLQYMREEKQKKIAKENTIIDVQLRTSEHRSMYSYVRLSIDRCTATYV